METVKKRRHVWIWITILSATILMLAALGWKLYNTLPIYDNFRKQVATISELRKELNRNEDMRNFILMDLTEFDYEISDIETVMDGRNRRALPVSFSVSFLPMSGSEYTFGLGGGLVKNDPNRFQQLTEEYRGTPSQCKITKPNVSDLNGYVELYLTIGSYYYWFGGSFNAENLTKEEIITQEEQLKQLLYSMADWVIDSVPR